MMECLALDSTMNFKNDAQRRAVFCNMNRFARKDPFQQMLTSKDIQHKIVVGGESDIDFDNQPNATLIYNDTPVYYIAPENTKLPESLEHHFKEEYGEGFIPLLEEDLEALMDRGFSYDESVYLLGKIRDKKRGFAGGINELIGKRKGKDLDSYVERAEKFHDTLSSLERGEDKRTDTSGLQFVEIPGVRKAKIAAVQDTIAENYGVGALDHFDYNSIDWSEDIKDIKEHIRKNLKYYEGEKITFSNSSGYWCS